MNHPANIACNAHKSAATLIEMSEREESDMRVQNINEDFGEQITFDSLDEFAAAISTLGYMPEDGLVEGRDYEIVADASEETEQEN